MVKSTKKETPKEKEIKTEEPSVSDFIGPPPAEVSSEPKAAYTESSGEPRGEYWERPENQTYEVAGYLDIQPEGHGFLRPKFIPSSRDIYISQSQIRRFLLRGGDFIEGLGRPPKDTERYFGLLKVEKVNGKSGEESLKRPYFDDLTPI